MREFFRGWRRKAGFVTLVMACVVMGLWLRSLAIEDCWTKWQEPKTTYFVASRNQQLIWGKQEGILWSRTGGWKSRKLAPSPFESVSDYQSQVRNHWCGFRFEAGETELRGELIGTQSLVVRAVPYWSLVLPPTLLSACLILWPGKRVTKQVANSEGA